MFGHYGQMRPGTPGDNGPPQLRPEIIAAEQRILTCADTLLTWMIELKPWDPKVAQQIDGFFAHITGNPLAHKPQSDPLGDKNYENVSHYVLDKMDPDANRFMYELLRAAWERRCWQQNYGERESVK